MFRRAHGKAITMAVLLALGCSSPISAPQSDAGADAARAAMDASDADVPCPAAPASAIGGACERPERVCGTSACTSSPCASDCVEIVCRDALDGARWEAAPRSCADAAMPDAATDAGVPGCSLLSEDRGSIVADLGAAGGLLAIVWDGSSYALVWSELESTSPVLAGLYFGRVEPDGDVLPGSVHRILPADQYQLDAALAVGDGELGLAYLTLPSDGLTAGSRAHFVRLDRDGNPIPGSDLALSDEHAPHEALAIAYAPPLRQWAIAWQGTVPLGGGYVHSHVYLSRVDEAGAVIEPNAVQLDAEVTVDSPDKAPSFVWTGDRYAIVLAEYVDIPDTRVSIAEIDPASAAVTRRIVLHEGGRPVRAVLATDGTRYGAAWMQIGWDALDVQEVRFRTAIVGGDALGTEVLLADGEGSGEPSILFDGTTFRLAFYHGDADTGGVWYARFDRDGAMLGTAAERFTTTPPFSAFPLIASDGCNDVIGWTAVTNGPPESAVLHVNTIAGAM